MDDGKPVERRGELIDKEFQDVFAYTEWAEVKERPAQTERGRRLDKRQFRGCNNEGVNKKKSLTENKYVVWANWVKEICKCWPRAKQTTEAPTDAT